MVTCPSCGQQNPEGFRFCGSCATPLIPGEAQREERKRVSVLFCDLVGFTGRAEAMDPEDVRALLRSYHERLRADLERFGGTVEKFIGDAVMAVFGAPVAHEDDPERAVRAALAIRDWAREQPGIEVRIGVHTGQALVSLGARPEFGEGMVAGDVVNTAARLQTAAPTNGIFVGESTYRATRSRMEYREARPVDAKGKGRPVLAWEAIEARSRVEVERTTTAPLIGRERELDALRGALDRAKDRREPQLVTIVGVPGIGKSRIVYELFRSIEQSDELVYWRRGRSLPYGAGVSFWALAEIVKAQAGILETDTDDTVARKLRETVESLLGDDPDRAWVEAHLHPVVGIGHAGEAQAAGRDDAFAAWRRLLEALADERPLVLVFEDLHWADDAMLDFVDHLVDWARDVPMLVVATARPELLERRPAWGGGKSNALTLSLAPLSADETARLFAALLERQLLRANDEAALLARAEGNPLYAEEFARLAAEGNAPTPGAGLPESVEGIVAARLDTLASDEKALLQEASVVGRTFWLGALALTRDRQSAEQILHALDRKDFVRRERRSSVATEVEYSFRHALVREVAYAQIPRARRADLHRRTAEWIEGLGRPDDHSEFLAHHYGEALEYGRASGADTTLLAARARDVLTGAGDRALALGAAGTAERFYEHALELWPLDEPRRAAALLGLARAVNYQRLDIPTLEQARSELISLGRMEEAAEVSVLLSHVAHNVGDIARCHVLMREALDFVGEAPSSRSKAAVIAELARLEALVVGRPEEAIVLAERALAIAEALNLPDLESRILNTRGIAKLDVGDDSGHDDMNRSIERAERAGSPVEQSRAHSNRGVVLLNLGDVRSGTEWQERALALAERLGTRIVRFIRGNLVGSYYSLGRWDDALSAADRFIGEVEAGSPHFQESQVRATRAAIRLARDDVEGALADDERALAHARELGDAQSLPSTLCQSAWLRAQIGRSAEAAGRVDEVLQRPGYIWWPDLAFALDRLGRSAELLEVADLDRRPSRWRDAARVFASGEFASAADVFVEIGAMPEEAYSRLRAAESLSAEGRAAEADQQLQRALAFYRSVDATRYMAEGERLLARTT